MILYYSFFKFYVLKICPGNHYFLIACYSWTPPNNSYKKQTISELMHGCLHHSCLIEIT